jgi:hypothetical protein
MIRYYSRLLSPSRHRLLQISGEAPSACRIHYAAPRFLGIDSSVCPGTLLRLLFELMSNKTFDRLKETGARTCVTGGAGGLDSNHQGIPIAVSHDADHFLEIP